MTDLGDPVDEFTTPGGVEVTVFSHPDGDGTHLLKVTAPTSVAGCPGTPHRGHTDAARPCPLVTTEHEPYVNRTDPLADHTDGRGILHRWDHIGAAWYHPRGGTCDDASCGGNVSPDPRRRGPSGTSSTTTPDGYGDRAQRLWSARALGRSVATDARIYLNVVTQLGVTVPTDVAGALDDALEAVRELVEDALESTTERDGDDTGDVVD